MVKKQGTSANIVHLGGWLTIEEVRSIMINGRAAVSILGWIHTEKPVFENPQPSKTSYPVVLAGAPADVVLAHARTHAGHPVKVVTSGRLYRGGERCLVKVKFVEILDVSTGPLASQDEAVQTGR